MCVWTFCMLQILGLSSILHIWLLCGYTVITAMSTWHCHLSPFNSLAPERCCCGHKLVIFKLISRKYILSIFNATALRWMPRVLTDDYSALIQVMAWCHQKTSHYLGQCWPRSMSPYGIMPLWVSIYDSVWVIVGSISDFSSRLHVTQFWLVIWKNHTQRCFTWIAIVISLRNASEVTQKDIGNIGHWYTV